MIESTYRFSQIDQTGLKRAVIDLGYQGEYDARQIIIKVASVLDEFPLATFTVTITRPGSTEVYIPTITTDEDSVSFVVSGYDTAYAGNGTLVINALEGDSLLKSAIADTLIKPSQSGTVGDPPASPGSWIDDVLQAAEDATEAAETAVTAKNSAVAADEHVTALNAAIQSGLAAIIAAVEAEYPTELAALGVRMTASEAILDALKWLDAARYGCDNTGVTECSALINTLSNVHPFIRFPAGTYSIGGYLYLRNGSMFIGETATLQGTGTDKYCFFANGTSNTTVKGFTMRNFRRAADYRNGSRHKFLDCDVADMYRNSPTWDDCYMLVAMNVNDLTVKDIHYSETEANSDCIRIKDTCSRILIENVEGTAGDDFIALVTDENETANIIDGVTIRNVRTGSGTFRGIRFGTSLAGSYIRNVLVENSTLYGNSAGPVGFVNTPSGGYEAGYNIGKVQHVRFVNCILRAATNASSNPYPVQMTGIEMSNLFFDKCQFIFDSTNASNNRFISIDHSTVSRLDITGCWFDNFKTVLMPILYLDANTTITALFVDKLYCAARVIDTVMDYMINSLGTISNAVISNSIFSNAQAVIHTAKTGNIAVTNISGANRYIVHADGEGNASIITGSNVISSVADVLADVSTVRIKGMMTCANANIAGANGDYFIYKTATAAVLRRYSKGMWANAGDHTYHLKKWAVVGDSLTAANSKTTKNYHGYVADELGLVVHNMGVSETGYKNTDGSSTAFYQRISSVPADTNVVTIFGSGNDLYSGAALGNITDTGTTTLCGCINTTIDNLFAVLPTVPLGIVTPTPWGSYPPTTAGNAMELYADALVAICKRRGIPCLDLYHLSGLRPWEAAYLPLMYSRDGGGAVHPDENGHRLIASAWREFVRALLGA